MISEEKLEKMHKRKNRQIRFRKVMQFIGNCLAGIGLCALLLIGCMDVDIVPIDDYAFSIVFAAISVVLIVIGFSFPKLFPLPKQKIRK